MTRSFAFSGFLVLFCLLFIYLFILVDIPVRRSYKKMQKRIPVGTWDKNTDLGPTTLVCLPCFALFF